MILPKKYLKIIELILVNNSQSESREEPPNFKAIVTSAFNNFIVLTHGK